MLCDDIRSEAIRRGGAACSSHIAALPSCLALPSASRCRTCALISLAPRARRAPAALSFCMPPLQSPPPPPLCAMRLHYHCLAAAPLRYACPVAAITRYRMLAFCPRAHTPRARRHALSPAALFSARTARTPPRTRRHLLYRAHAAREVRHNGSISSNIISSDNEIAKSYQRKKAASASCAKAKIMACCIARTATLPAYYILSRAMRIYRK